MPAKSAHPYQQHTCTYVYVGSECITVSHPYAQAYGDAHCIVLHGQTTNFYRELSLAVATSDNGRAKKSLATRDNQRKVVIADADARPLKLGFHSPTRSQVYMHVQLALVSRDQTTTYSFQGVIACSKSSRKKLRVLILQAITPCKN